VIQWPNPQCHPPIACMSRPPCTSILSRATDGSLNGSCVAHDPSPDLLREYLATSRPVYPHILSRYRCPT
jgi:hypothetical protein